MYSAILKWSYLRLTNAPAPIMAELKKYIAELDPKQEHVFTDDFSQCRWTRIREVIGEADLKFHDLRKSFSSALAQNGISTAVIQKLLEHSSPELTNKIYTNVDPVLRRAIDHLPVDNWL